MEESKEMWREVRFLCFTQTGKRMILVCDKLCIYEIIRRTSTEKLYKQKHLKTILINQNGILKKNVQVIQWKQKTKNEKKKETSQKQKN